MPHIHIDPGQHDATVSAFIINTSGPEPRLWLHRHKLIDQWLQFGGHIELHETPWQAICHEIEEESGYDMSQLKVLQPAVRLKASEVTVHPVPFTAFTHKFPGLDHYHSDTTLAFVTNQDPLNEIGNNESAKLQMMTRQELLDIPAGDMPENVRDMGLFLFDNILNNWQPVSTAEFVR